MTTDLPYIIPRRILDAAVDDAGGPAEAGWIDHHGVIHVTTTNVNGAMTFTAALAARLVAAAAARGATDADIARAGTVALVKSSFNALDAQVADKGGTESSVVVMSMRNCIPGDDAPPEVAATVEQANAEVGAALADGGVRQLVEQWNSRPATSDRGVATLVKLTYLTGGAEVARTKVGTVLRALPGVTRVTPFTEHGLQVYRRRPQ